MAKHDHFYQRAYYYDVVFDRDVTPEVDFIQQAYQHCSGRPLTSVLDIACGPGYHAREFARRGVRAVGLDLRPEMVEYARQKDAAEGLLSLEWVCADMRDFTLPDPVDAAFTMFDGLDVLIRNEDVVRHLQAVARSLTPAGIYLIDFTHPRDLSYAHYHKFHYTGERDGVRVEVFWATNDPMYDLVTGCAHVEMELHIDDHGEQFVIRDSADERLFTPQELQLLAELSGGFDLVGAYGAADLSQPLDFSPASERMLLLFQKRRMP